MPRDLTNEEIKANSFPIGEAKLKEIKGLFELGCFKRVPRASCRNIIDARWVITWKLIDGVVAIKCRLTARGFKDKMQELETYAGTTSRYGQRIVNAIAAEHEDFVLFSFDVSQAFAKGMTFKELSELTGTELREVQFDIPQADVDILKAIKGFEGYDPRSEILYMIKPIYGLKDAPRAWRKKLHQVLIGWLQTRQLYAEPELYCTHASEGKYSALPPNEAEALQPECDPRAGD